LNSRNWDHSTNALRAMNLALVTLIEDSIRLFLSFINE